jgi:hypothetical protein
MPHLSRRVALSLAAAMLYFAAGSPLFAEVKASKELLHGTWNGKVEIDEAALKADEKFKEIPAEQADLVLGLLKNQFGKMTMVMTFNADGTATAESDGPGVPAKDRKKEGKWEVVKAEGAVITVKVTPTGSGEKDPPKEFVLTFASEKELSMGLPGKLGADAMPKGIAFKFSKK